MEAVFASDATKEAHPLCADINGSDMNSSNDSISAGTESDEEAKSPSSKATFSQRRNMPSRASKENSRLKIQNLTIHKKKAGKSKTRGSLFALSSADIKKIYLNNSLTKFRPSNLETIFEEPTSEPTESSDEGQARFLGSRKIKRFLTLTDGYKKSKVLTKQRRAKVKRAFGRRSAHQKITMEVFMERMKQNEDDTDDGAAAPTSRTATPAQVEKAAAQLPMEFVEAEIFTVAKPSDHKTEIAGNAAGMADLPEEPNAVVYEDSFGNKTAD